MFSKIRVAVHKHGIRTTEFFRDHDKLRSGIITENQVNLEVLLILSVSICLLFAADSIIGKTNFCYKNYEISPCITYIVLIDVECYLP